MYVAALRIEIRLKDCRVAWIKRRRVRSILEKLHRHFNVSVAEVGRSDDPGAATLAVAAVAEGRREGRDRLDRVLDALAAHPRAELLAHALIEA